MDPARSSVEFHVRHFYGLMTVHGHVDRYEGTLDLDRQPASARASTPQLRLVDNQELTFHPNISFRGTQRRLERAG